VIRVAKEAFNGIDLQDVRRSYRYEQGFTFELNLSGVSDRLRESFGRSERPESKPESERTGSEQPGSEQPGSERPGSERARVRVAPPIERED